jgi:hypothetical protein
VGQEQKDDGRSADPEVLEHGLPDAWLLGVED